MTPFVVLTAGLQHREALRGDPWAAGQHWDVSALSFPHMVRTHGSLNALGFVAAGLARHPRSTHEEAVPWGSVG